MQKYTDKQRLDFLENRAYREYRDGGWSASFHIGSVPAMAMGPWQATNGGEFDYDSFREAIDAMMRKLENND